ncbi:MAG: LON peptidase substrate-binding domain-containing protein [Solirubrobacteraceae bacterium]|nr:LON peptidase substrate-binding domain-containing protein [Solirubrobacteraceae bacterium]
MADRLVRDFPLFPLDLVALPHEQIPLHIFEDRYRTMIAECLERGSEFGIVWLDDEQLREIGCACKVEEVLEQMEDGRMNILVRGTQPFRIVTRQDEFPYPAGTIELLCSVEEDPDIELTERAQEAYAELVRQATDDDPDPERIAGLDSYGMAATVDFGLEAKQSLLDLRSENARLKLVTRLFLAATKRLDFIERAQARARSNGKVRFG